MKKDDNALNRAISYADMADALDKWFIKGQIDYKRYKTRKDALTMAFQIACAEYLTKRTELVCGKEER